MRVPLVAQTSAGRLKLIGGRLCLDFVNTVGGRDVVQVAGRPPEAQVLSEKLITYDDLVRWSEHLGTITGKEARTLIELAAQSKARSARLLVRAIALREALYRIFRTAIYGVKAPKTDLELLNREILEARTHETLVRAGAQFSWEWTALDGSLDRPLWPVARSAGELLTSADLAKVRECAGAHCGWLFVDTSKNRRRQWCYMEGGCGNLAKVHRYRERLRRSASR